MVANLQSAWKGVGFQLLLDCCEGKQHTSGGIDRFAKYYGVLYCCLQQSLTSMFTTAVQQYGDLRGEITINHG